MNETHTPPPATPSPAAAPSAAPPPPAATPYPVIVDRKSPALAGFLSCFPGLGHLYLGLYPRAFAVGGAFILGIMMTSHGGPGEFFGPIVAFVWFFGVIDAVRQAKAINATGKPEANVLGSDEPVRVSGSLTAGILLILIGGFLILNRFVTIDLSFLNDWWPILLVAFGAWQVYRHYQDRRPPSGEGSVPQ